MQYPDETDAEDLAEDNAEIVNEAQEDYSEDNSPTYTKAEDLYSLFWKTIKITDSSKVGNLDKKELGMLDISVRDLQYIADTATILGEDAFAKWLTEQAQIILRTSASKNGWLTELFVTAKRYASKEKRLGVNPPALEQKPQSFWEKLKRK